MPGSGNPPGGSGSAEILTNAEQVAILDGQLERGTGDFDDLILEERGRIQRTTKSAPPADAEPAPPGTYGGGGGGEATEAADYGVGSGRGRGGQQGPVPRDKYEGDIPQQAASFPAPADIPTGDDDDVVARQLREAAMREPDPQLREKLWDEYRKYKGIAE
jgi:hypothetical protein